MNPADADFGPRPLQPTKRRRSTSAVMMSRSDGLDSRPRGVTGRTFAAFGSSGVRGMSVAMALGSAGLAAAQTSPLLAPASDVDTPASTFETRQLPVAPPWLTAGTPTSPDWLQTPAPSLSPFLRPGLGSASFGDGPLQSVSVIRRARDGNGPTPLPVGPLDIGLDATYGLTYGTGLLGNRANQAGASVRHTLTPGLSLFAGDRWSLRYAPTASFFSEEGFKDTFDQAVRLQGGASAPSWDFGLNHASSISSTPLIETGRQTDQTLHSTGLTAGWDANGRDALSFSLSQSLRFADDAPDSISWSNQNWYDRPLTEKVSAGLGIGFGYDHLDPGTDMISERFNARLQGRLGTKVGYSISAGAEVRQFLGTDSSSKLSPLVSASLTYQVFAKTSVFAGYDYSISTSFFTDQFTQNSSVQCGITQVLTERWSLTASGGLQSTRYESTIIRDSTERVDDSTFGSLSLTWQIWRRFSTAISYSYRANSSDRSAFDFDSHQLGFRLAYSL